MAGIIINKYGQYVTILVIIISQIALVGNVKADSQGYSFDYHGRIIHRIDVANNIGIQQFDFKFDSKNIPHILFIRGYKLWYGVYNNSDLWNIQTIGGANNYNAASFILDNKGQPHVCCLANGSLYYGFLNGNSWTIDNVDTGVQYCTNIALLNNNPVFVYNKPDNSGNRIIVTLKNGSNWNKTVVDYINDVNGVIGLGSLAIDKIGMIHVVYTISNVSVQELKYSTILDNNISRQVIDTSVYSPVLSIDKYNYVHLIYCRKNYTGTYLYYLINNGIGWQKEFVTNGVPMWAVSISLNNTLSPYICFASSDKIYYFFRDINDWIEESIDVPGQPGVVYEARMTSNNNGDIYFCYFNHYSLWLEYVGLQSNVSKPTFSIDFASIKSIYSQTILIPTKTVKPGGGQTQGEITASNNTMNITLAIPNVGNAFIEIDPLGEHTYTIPGLSYNYLGVNLGIEMMVKGFISCNITVSGKGNSTTTSLEWDTPGSKFVTVASSSDSVNGDSISLTLRDIKYILWLEVIASGNVTGVGHKEVTLIDYHKLGEILGKPSSITGTINVQNESTISMPDNLLYYIIPIVIIVIVIFVVIVLLIKSTKQETEPIVQQPEKMYQQPNPSSQFINHPMQDPNISLSYKLAQANSLVLCPYCNNSLTWVNQYHRWFCPYCGRYI